MWSSSRIEIDMFIDRLHRLTTLAWGWHRSIQGEMPLNKWVGCLQPSGHIARGSILLLGFWIQSGSPIRGRIGRSAASDSTGEEPEGGRYGSVDRQFPRKHRIGRTGIVSHHCPTLQGGSQTGCPRGPRPKPTTCAGQCTSAWSEAEHTSLIYLGCLKEHHQPSPSHLLNAEKQVSSMAVPASEVRGSGYASARAKWGCPKDLGFGASRGPQLVTIYTNLTWYCMVLSYMCCLYTCHWI